MPGFQNRLVAAYPNVTVIDIGAAIDLLADLVRDITVVIRFFTVFSIIAGVLIIISSVLATRFARIQEFGILQSPGRQTPVCAARFRPGKCLHRTGERVFSLVPVSAGELDSGQPGIRAVLYRLLGVQHPLDAVLRGAGHRGRAAGFRLDIKEETDHLFARTVSGINHELLKVSGRKHSCSSFYGY